MPGTVALKMHSTAGVGVQSEREALVEAWLKYHETLEGSGDLTGTTSVADDYLWATERLDDIVRQDPEISWLIILELFSRARSNYQLACLASGPLEDFLARHGHSFIERVEQVASSNAAIREALRGVWKNEIPEDVWVRIERARAVRQPLDRPE